MAFRLSHLSLALSLLALVHAGAAASILTLNNNNADQNSDSKLTQSLSPSACIFSAVRRVVNRAINRERRMGASLIRLHFHDCFVDGCDGGVLLDDIPGSFLGEKTSPPNNHSVRGFEVIDQAKQRVKATCPNTPVSCADILAIAARDSVVKLGGQGYNVALGRRDARTANFTGALTQLPAPFDNLTVQLRKFNDKTFNAREMVALAGAHTVGFTRCINACNSAFVNPAARIQCNCSVPQNDTNLQRLDGTPARFDRVYFQDLNRNQGILFSDQVLTGNATTAAVVTTYSNNAAVFFGDFAAAMIKMGDLPPSPGAQLEIRDVCSRVNPSSVASM